PRRPPSSPLVPYTTLFRSRKLILRRAYGKPELRPSGAAGVMATVASWVKRPESCGFAVPFHGRGRLLDFGCGSGTFLRRMAAQTDRKSTRLNSSHLVISYA